MWVIRWMAVAMLAWGMLAARAADTGTDPAHKYAWAENAGWVSAHSTDHGVTVRYYEGEGGWLSGYAWGENIGWIVMGSGGGGPYLNNTAENWGVNLAADGKLSGYAWGENVGWINFGHAHCDAAINPANGAFSGHAWGENIGWLKFNGAAPDYGVRSMAFYTQPKGTPNWWLANHGVDEGYDVGDDVPAWRKYVMDTDPNREGDYLRITSISNAVGEAEVAFAPASTRRYYTLRRRADLTTGSWSNVVGQINIPGTAGEQSMTDGEPASAMFYHVNVRVAP